MFNVLALVRLFPARNGAANPERSAAPRELMRDHATRPPRKGACSVHLIAVLGLAIAACSRDEPTAPADCPARRFIVAVIAKLRLRDVATNLSEGHARGGLS
jgi:hypothetical protein